MSPTDESFARVGDLDLCWQRFGDPEAPPLLMIMGLGAQMILWPEGLCELLADRGFGVSASTIATAAVQRSWTRREPLDQPGRWRATSARRPTRCPTWRTTQSGCSTRWGRAGPHRRLLARRMVAQTLAIGTRSGALAGFDHVDHRRPRGRQAHAGGAGGPDQPPPADREGYIESTVRARAMIGSPGFPRDEQYARELAGRMFDRGYHPEGTLRQVAAIIASGDRTRSCAGCGSRRS